jgi:hypothetical protein
MKMEAILKQNTIGFQKLSGARIWTGYILSGLSSLFLLFDGVMKLFKPAVVVNGTVELGYSEAVIIPLGIVLTAITILYVVPRTAVLGAVLLTGYLGGAVATHVRVGNGAFEIVFPIVFGALVWGGLYLRDHRVAELLPIRK